MAGKFSGTTTPGRGYTEAVTQSRGISDPSGRAVPDERRTFSEQREENFPGSADDDTNTGQRVGYGADPQNPPPLSAATEEGSASVAEDMESDEAASGRIQGG
jgi:hypothetical protein